MLDSPYRLTALTLAASFLGIAAFLSGELRSVYTSPPLLSTFFVCLMLGVIGMFSASHTLREGVRNERWPEETLAPFRQITGHMLWRIGMGALVVAMLLALAQDRDHRIWFWAILLLPQTQTQLTNAFALPRKPGTAGARLDWSHVAPLCSEHWRER